MRSRNYNLMNNNYLPGYLPISIVKNAIVLIKVESKQFYWVLQELKKIVKNDDIHMLFGEYDLLLRMEPKDICKLADKYILPLKEVKEIMILI